MYMLMCLVAVTTSLALPVVEAANLLDHMDNGPKDDIHAGHTILYVFATV